MRCNVLLLVFQHTAARRRLLRERSGRHLTRAVSTHSRPKAAANSTSKRVQGLSVSTHSRPKAAAPFHLAILRCHNCFNTQPPEGGCFVDAAIGVRREDVSTHSRPKAAAHRPDELQPAMHVSTHSRPKAAADYMSTGKTCNKVSTHSRPKAAAY